MIMIKIELEKLLAGRSLYWLSQKANVRWATLATMANGKARRLDLDALERICEALDCQPGNLLVSVQARKKKAARKR
jgi:putative transcriptional regulator